MRKRRSEDLDLLKKFNKMQTTSSVIWILAGVGILAFGVYYKEIFEIIFGALTTIYGIAVLKNRNVSLNAIARREKKRLNFLVLAIVVFSLVNPIGNIPVIYDLYKRDYVIRGGFDEK
ncbi:MULTISPECIES: hypothetical protein [Anaerococcus]|uniref:Uncharacterized protein n=1 Tax=Anaerococcus octavius TaxID=54007 RepID=A0A2I1M6K1_9FIRM|nr:MULTISPECIES: hypothetical protein [Anaerococcus]MDU7411036.1 hypothetical protein [Anaerococcus sp.]PKZ15729.1 hypothetical protein CYJ34_07965 [Anaerococcus octavius]